MKKRLDLRSDFCVSVLFTAAGSLRVVYEGNTDNINNKTKINSNSNNSYSLSWCILRQPFLLLLLKLLPSTPAVLFTVQFNQIYIESKSSHLLQLPLHLKYSSINSTKNFQNSRRGSVANRRKSAAPARDSNFARSLNLNIIQMRCSLTAH